MREWGWKGYFRMLFILGLLSWPMDGLGEHSEKSLGDRFTMGLIDQGKRLIPLRFEEEVTIGEKTRKRTTRFDYGARKISVETQRESKVSREELEIPPGVLYDDPMTAHYNLR